MIRRRSPRRGPVVILMYHRVAADGDPFRLAVHPDRFAAQMDLLHRYADPARLADVTGPARHPRVVVTFDDGYADNALTALPALETAGVPATVFVTSGMVDSPATMWPLHLERLVRTGRARSERLRLHAGGTDVIVSLAAGADREVSMRTIHDRLRDLPPQGVAAAMATIEEQFEPLAPDPGRRMLTRDELLELAASDLVTVGAHTRRHPQLSALGAGDQLEEIAGSRADLESMIGRPVTEFAYPYGTRPSFDRRSVRAVRQAGFSVACTTIPDPVVAGTSVWRLPRRMVLDWDPPEFAAHLAEWLAA